MTDRKDVAGAAWRTSSYSTSGNQCVEVGPLPSGEVAVRDSKIPAAGVHVVSRTAWTAFTKAIKNKQL